MKHKIIAQGAEAIIYHGSPRKLEGELLLPKQADDLNKNPDNLSNAIYATDIKNAAIAMAIIKCEGISSSSLDINKKTQGIIYNGWPKQEHIYLCYLPQKIFTQSVKMKHQFISKEPVKPIKIEKLNIKDYLHLVRKATPEEIIIWKNKHDKF